MANGRGTSSCRTPNNAKDQEKNGSISQSADAKKNGEEADKYVQVGSSSSIGVDPVSVVVARYSHDDPLVRFRPRLQLRDLNDCMFMPVLNRSLAEKLHSVQVFANGYKLSDIRPSDFLVDYSPFTAELSGSFTDKELADPWVRIRPSALASSFHLMFTSTTPRRMYGYEEMPGVAQTQDGRFGS